MRKFNFTLIIIITVLAFRIRFVLDGHLVPIAQLVPRFIFRLATYLFLAGLDPASSPFSVVSLNISISGFSSITEQSSDIKIRCDRIRA